MESLETRNLLASSLIEFIYPGPNETSAAGANAGDIIVAEGTHFGQDGIDDLALLSEGGDSDRGIDMYLIPGNAPLLQEAITTPGVHQIDLAPFHAGDKLNERVDNWQWNIPDIFGGGPGNGGGNGLFMDYNGDGQQDWAFWLDKGNAYLRIEGLDDLVAAHAQVSAHQGHD